MVQGLSFLKVYPIPDRMKILLISSLLFACAVPGYRAQDQPVRIIVFGAHPDDCDNDRTLILFPMIKTR
jgi:hypothetical protein